MSRDDTGPLWKEVKGKGSEMEGEPAVAT